MGRRSGRKPYPIPKEDHTVGSGNQSGSTRLRVPTISTPASSKLTHATAMRQARGSRRRSCVNATTYTAAAGREPAEIRRVLNVNGLVTDGPVGELVEGPADHWVETLSGFATDLGSDTLVFWPTESPVEQLERFGREVVPALRG